MTYLPNMLKRKPLYAALATATLSVAGFIGVPAAAFAETPSPAAAAPAAAPSPAPQAQSTDDAQAKKDAKKDEMKK